jgi:uncharacterized membrane protein
MMAGIGIELQRMLRKNTLGSVTQAYALAGLVGSGPWLISIVAILAIGMIATLEHHQGPAVEQFQVSVSYLMAASLILTSPLQLLFTRYAADRMYERREAVVLPNLMGALTVTMIASVLTGSAALLLWFDEPWPYQLCMLANFVVLSCIWIVQIFASAIRAFRPLLGAFALGYVITAWAALALRPFGLVGLLSGFFAGQAVLLFALLIMVVRQFPATDLMAFDFLRRDQVFPRLALIGLLYNLAVWSDKFVFWRDPLTGTTIVGPLRASVIYDLPIFLAYLSIVPGMAVLMVRLEVELAQKCEAFFRTITSGGNHRDIALGHQQLMLSVRRGLTDTAKAQAVTTAIVMLFGSEILSAFGVSPLYGPLFGVDLVAVALQLMLLAMLSIFFYLDRQAHALMLSAMLLVSNAAFSWISVQLGPQFYGYGFGCAVLLTCATAALCLSRTLDYLVLETFMLQPAARHAG